MPPKRALDSSEDVQHYLTLIDGASNKFYEISSTALSVIVKYGRIGNAAQSTTKVFETREAMEKHIERNN
jgi:predicted DNA-binding WGR domain protein